MLLKLFLTLYLASSYILADGELSCVLPPYQEHGSYIVVNEPNAEPGKAFDSVHLNITCSPGYDIIGQHNVFCVHGIWSNDLPKCLGNCNLNKHPSVTYNCIDDTNDKGMHRCLDREPEGTVVVPECNKPHYYSPGSLPNMKCIDGSWDYVAICQTECGTVIPQHEELKRSTPTQSESQVPWHAAIYSKNVNPFLQICVGSLISPSIVISAAHCFWSEVDKLKPVSNFAVAVGMNYRRWNDPHNYNAQKSDVKEIKITSHFYGAATNYQDDISLVFVTTPFEYRVHVRPVCLDFDVIFDRRQLGNGRGGKLPGWNHNEEKKELKFVDVNTDTQSCLSKVPDSFKPYITSDKFCGEIVNDTITGRGNGGAGVVVPESDGGKSRYYLRGILSTAPVDGDGQNQLLSLFTSTHILKHEHFIKSHLI